VSKVPKVGMAETVLAMLLDPALMKYGSALPVGGLEPPLPPLYLCPWL